MFGFLIEKVPRKQLSALHVDIVVDVGAITVAPTTPTHPKDVTISEPLERCIANEAKKEEDKNEKSNTTRAENGQRTYYMFSRYLFLAMSRPPWSFELPWPCEIASI